MDFGASARKVVPAALAISSVLLAGGAVPSAAQNSKPNIVMLGCGWATED